MTGMPARVSQAFSSCIGKRNLSPPPQSRDDIDKAVTTARVRARHVAYQTLRAARGVGSESKTPRNWPLASVWRPNR